jgi:hypothetical protein
MLIYTFFAIIISGLLTALVGANPMLYPVFYGIVFVGMLPGYWACERDLEEKWAITISSLILMIGQLFVLGLLFEGILSGVTVKQIATTASSGLFLIFTISLSVMWLGLFFFSVWCGTSEAK